MQCHGMAWDATGCHGVHGVYDASVCFACFKEQEAQEEEVDTYQIDAKLARLAAQTALMHSSLSGACHCFCFACMNESQCICVDKA